MMIMNLQTKQERGTEENKLSKTVPSSSRQWSSFRNPRIVRVSRTFGGKDRHSKVCTIRGLRDRRIRLSVPTAVQLYDLQDKLGLSQPSKVVDWLLDATKDEIDKLPPLQIPPGGSFSQFHHHPSLLASHQDLITSPQPQPSLSHFFHGGTQALLRSKEGIKFRDHGDHEEGHAIFGRSRHWGSDAAALGSKSKGVDQKEKWVAASNDQENQVGIGGGYGGGAHQISAQNFFPVHQSAASFQAMLNNTSLPNNYNSYYQMDSSNLSLSSQVLGNHSLSSQTDQQDSSHNVNPSVSFASSLALPSWSQLYFCPPATTIPSVVPPYYPPYMTTTPPPETESTDPRQTNNFQVLSSNPQHLLPNSLVPTLHLLSSPATQTFALNINSKINQTQESDKSQQNQVNIGSD